MAVIPTQTDYELSQLKVRNNKLKVEVLKKMNNTTVAYLKDKILSEVNKK